MDLNLTLSAAQKVESDSQMYFTGPLSIAMSLIKLSLKINSKFRKRMFRKRQLSKMSKKTMEKNAVCFDIRDIRKND